LFFDFSKGDNIEKTNIDFDSNECVWIDVKKRLNNDFFKEHKQVFKLIRSLITTMILLDY